MERSSKDPYKQDLYFRGTFFTRIILVKRVPLKTAIFEQDRLTLAKSVHLKHPHLIIHAQFHS